MLYQHQEESYPAPVDIGVLIYACVTPIVLLVGLVGNSLCLLVFRVKRLRSTPTGTSCATILSALSAADLLVLLCHVAPEWSHRGLPTLINTIRQEDASVSIGTWNKQSDWNRSWFEAIMLTNVSNVPVKQWSQSPDADVVASTASMRESVTVFLHQPGIFQIYILVSYVLRMMSVWLLVLFTIERYIGVCHPFKSNLFRTRSKVRRAILILFLVTLIVCAYKPILSFVGDTDLLTTSIKNTRGTRSSHTNKVDLARSSDTENQTGSLNCSRTNFNRTVSTIGHEYAKIVFILDSCYAVLLTLLPFLVILSLNLRIITQLCQHTPNLLSNHRASDCKTVPLVQQPRTMSPYARSARVLSRCFSCLNVCSKSSISTRSKQSGGTGSAGSRCTIGHYPVADQFSWTSAEQYVPQPGCSSSGCSDNCSFSRTPYNPRAHSFDPPINSHCIKFTNPSRLAKFLHTLSCQKHAATCFHPQIHQQNQHQSRNVLHASHVKPVHNNHSPQPHQSSFSCGTGSGVWASRRGDRLGRQFAVTLLTISACFLLLNIPYLIVWTCRWYQVRMRLHTINLTRCEYMTRMETVRNDNSGTVDHGAQVPLFVEDLSKSVVQTIMSAVGLQNSSQVPGTLQSDEDRPSVHTFSESGEQLDWLRVALPITRTIFSLNYCINFFLYSLVGKYFRRELRRLFWGCKYSVFSHFCPARARQLVRQHQQQQKQPVGVRLNIWRPQTSADGVIVPARLCPCAVNRPVCNVQVLGVNSNLVSYMQSA